MNHGLRLAGLASATMITAVSTFCAAPANADETATVKARTQRMSEPNLGSQQDGWYNVGDRLTLSCWKRGQAVKGFFSFNIPGGFDNLWYRTSDGRFVADVDIETGTLNAVGVECGSAPAASQPPAAAPATQSSGLRWPLDAVNVTQGFGNPGEIYTDLGQRGHNGIDLGAPVGTPVFAAGDGTIQFEGYGQANSWMGKPAGICILIRHANVITGYAHLSRTVINQGQHVTRGQLIGYTGQSGLATGPHLHFETYPLNPEFDNGYSGRIDPGPYLG